MRYTLVLASLAALAVAAPRPQDLDFDAVNDAPQPTITGPPIDAINQTIVMDLTASASAAAAEITADPLRKRDVNDPCATQPPGSGPTTTPDTDSAFLAKTNLADISTSAPTPDGYTTSFTNLQDSVSGNVYMGLMTIQEYDPVECAQLCDAALGCVAFNLYFERDPSVNPADACPNPSSINNIKCTLWGTPVTPAMATNGGQWRDQFHVVIAGSNGYVKNAPPPAIPNFDGPTELGGAINAPLANGVNTYMGFKFYPGPYDPTICAAACLAQTAYDQSTATNGVYQPCNFFAAYVVSKDGIGEGLYCSMYTQPWDRSYGTNQGQYSGSDYYSVSQAYSYTLDPQDPGTIQS